MNPVLMSSEQTEWETPQKFFEYCNFTYGEFDLDAAATPSNAKCKQFFTKEDNALEREWRSIVWLNPPYGRDIGLFVAKAWEEVDCGHARRVVMLLPARTDTRWFHSYCKFGLIVFLKGRLKFVGAENSAPFPSMLVIFDNHTPLYQYSTVNITTLDWKEE